MEPIMKVAQKHGLYIIEDTAQAIGADYTFSDGDVRKAGTMGQVGTTSFFPSKNLGCYGDGGAMLVNDDDLASRIRMVANHGQGKRYYHDIIGVNSRLDAMQAAVLRAKLPHLDEYAAARRKVADAYDDAFSSIDRLETPKRHPKSTHVFHQYTLKTSGVDLDDIRSIHTEHEVPSMIYYPVPLHKQKAYEAYTPEGKNFPVSDDLATRVISLPVHTEMQDDQLAHIIDTVSEYFKSH
jgi:dTDP-4-amino-4,6-dideoxygalactose transaminase